MRLSFRSLGHANQYSKILLRAVTRAVQHMPEGARIGRQGIQDGIYRAFGYTRLSNFRHEFVPDPAVKGWFHSEEQLRDTFSRALQIAVGIVHGRGIELGLSIEELTESTVKEAMEANDRALQRVIANMSSVEDRMRLMVAGSAHYQRTSQRRSKLRRGDRK